MAASTSLTPEQRTLRARGAALSRWAGEDPTESMKHARSGFHERFRREVYEPGLTEAEIERRAAAAMRSHMTRLALASSKARSRGGDAA